MPVAREDDLVEPKTPCASTMDVEPGARRAGTCRRTAPCDQASSEAIPRRSSEGEEQISARREAAVTSKRAGTSPSAAD